MRVCPDCSAENDTDAPFCDACGSFLDWDSEPDPIASDRPATSRFESAPARTSPPPAAEPVTAAKPALAAPEEPAAAAEPEVLQEPDTPPEAEALAEPEAAEASQEAEIVEEPTRPEIVHEAEEPEVSQPPEVPQAPASMAKPAPERPPTTEDTDTAAETESPDPRQEERMRRLVARNAALPPGAAPPPPAPVRHTPETARTEPAIKDPGQVTPAETPETGPASASLASVIKIAERSGRTDLSSRLQASQREIRRTGVSVTVVGEYKKGKSNLVNALVNAEVCPSDPVTATVAPIVVHHGDELAASVTYARDSARPQPIELGQVAELASETGNPSNHLGVSQLDIALPRRLLATGLELIDTPGVGGLDSALGAVTLGALDSADGVLFVTDCSQELTAPELSYLSGARRRCESVICVMTKLDLYQHAGELAEINRGHLAVAGLDDVPLVTVSSVLHLLSLAESDAGLERESGFAELFDLVHQRIWEPARRRGLAKAGHQLGDLAEQLTIPVEAERRAMSSPESATRTLAELAEIQDRVRQFRSATARWQHRLNEGMQEAMADLDHDLRTRLRVVARTAEGRIESDDIADDLVFEAWLHKASMEAVVAHYEMIVDRASALVEEIAEHFVAFDRHARFEVAGAPPAEQLAAVHVTREASLLKDGVLRRVVTTTQGYSGGVILASSVLGVVPGLNWLPIVTLPIAGLMARRAFSDDRDRRRAARRQEFKRLASKYLDEIGFVVNKDSRDTLRRIHRQIRDHYMARAEQLEQTLQQAVAAAERARSADGTDADSAVVELEQTTAELQQMQTTAERLVAAAPAAS